MMLQLRPYQERALNAMQQHSKGQIIKTTGAGKTITMIADAMKELETKSSQTIVVVAPKILLTTQLCSEFTKFIVNARILHVHTGETPYDSHTNPFLIEKWVGTHKNYHKLIFTTYHSLHQIQESEIDVNTIYFDEAHHSTKMHFFPSAEHFSANADRCYFFTATRKTSNTIAKPGMNDVEVYGEIICRVTAPELIASGHILSPKVQSKQFEILKNNEITAERDKRNVLNTLEDIQKSKILICVKTTKQLTNLISQTNFIEELENLGYSYLYITSKTGAVVNGKRVNRHKFLETLKEWNEIPDKKFVLIHRSIMSEGLDCGNLDCCIFLRNMNTIEMVQTVGRIVRKGDPSKLFGLCVVPVYSKTGIATEKSVNTVVETVFERGDLMDCVIEK